MWYGVGFNAGVMKDLPYAIIVDGDGHVTERKLSDHGPGTQLMTTVKVQSVKYREMTLLKMSTLIACKE